jgi:hypothetical protein
MWSHDLLPTMNSNTARACLLVKMQLCIDGKTIRNPGPIQECVGDVGFALLLLAPKPSVNSTMSINCRETVEDSRIGTLSVRLRPY